MRYMLRTGIPRFIRDRLRVSPQLGLLPSSEAEISWRWRPVAVLALLGVIFCGAMMTLKSEARYPDSGDAREFLTNAYNLYHHGVYSDSLSEPPPASVAREPGYPVVLVAVFALDPAFGGVTRECLKAPRGCPPELYAAAQWINRGFAACAGLMLVIVGTILSRHWIGGLVAGYVIWVNSRLLKDLNFLISDALTLFLVSLTTLALIVAWRWRSPVLWAVAGFAVAGLALTKAVFFYFGLLLVLALVVACRCERRSPPAGRRVSVLSVVLFAMAFAVPTGLWMKRNAEVGGHYVVADHTRAARVLGTREAFNRFTPTQYAAALVYWTRGFGDNLARALFAPEVWKPFELDNPDGFYQSSYMRVTGRANDLMRERKVSRDEAYRIARDEEIMTILSRPVAYALTTPIVIYRGIWADEFAPVSFPLLLACLWAAVRRRRWEVWLVLAPGVFNLIFYALVSFNIPRYQTAAAPALALAVAVGVVALLAYLGRRKNQPVAS